MGQGVQAKTWQEKLAQRRQAQFIGRREPLRLFTDNFVAAEPEYLAYVVTGEGGVGKSTLLEQFAQIARAHDALPILCDERHLSPADAMGHVAAELAGQQIEYKPFNERYKKYRELRQEVEGDAKAPRAAVDVLVRGITDVTVKGLRRAPGVGLAFDLVDSEAAGKGLSELVQYGINRWGNKDEVQLLRDPAAALTPLFVMLLNQACARQRLVLMFDVFERTGPTLSDWLLALCQGEYGDFSLALSLVISGRDPLEQHWTELAGSFYVIPLEPFTAAETQTYLQQQGITDEALVTQIHTDTGGLPVLVELLAATRPQPGAPLPDISKDAVARFLQWTPDEGHRRIALLASAPRQFNRDILGAALDADAASAFLWLTAQSYIRTNTERGWFYHEKVRELMLRYLKNSTPAELNEAHSRLAAFFAQRQAALGLSGRDAYQNETWRAGEEERVYHEVSAQPDRGAAVAANAFLHAFRWRWGFSERLLLALRQAQRETGSRALQERVGLLADVYQAYDQSEYVKGLTALEQLQHMSGLEKVSQCEIHTLLGEILQWTEDYERSVAAYQKAIDLDEEYAWAIAKRGETYLLMEQYEAALADFHRAIELNEKYALAIDLRGVTYKRMGKYKAALADFNRAIELDEKDAWATVHRGLTYLHMEQYEAALADLDWVIKLGEKDRWGIATIRGMTYQLIELRKEMLAHFNRAIELDEKDASAVARRGDAYREMKQYRAALADFNRAIELDEKLAWAIASRGETYRQMGQYQAALADFNRAIELDETSNWNRYERFLVYTLLSQPGDAAADIGQAVALASTAYAQDQTNWRNTFNLALYCLAVGRATDSEKYYEEALAGCHAWHILREARVDLDDFLTVFPQNLPAADMRQRVEAALRAGESEAYH